MEERLHVRGMLELKEHNTREIKRNKRNLTQININNIKKLIKMFFIDEMRYGLISNYRRSWSKVGERSIDNQQEYSNRYLYSAIDPINGDNFHMYSVSDVNTLVTKTLLWSII